MSSDARDDGLLRSQSFVRLVQETGLSEADVDLLYKRAARYARTDDDDAGETEDYVGFMRCDTLYATPVSALRRIVPLDHLSRIPGGARHVPGVFSYRGDVLSGHDLAAFLGANDPAEPDWALIVEAKDGDIGLLADEITTLFEVSEPEVQAVPLTLGARGSGFRGILSDGTLLVQPRVLFQDPAFVYAFAPPEDSP